MDDMNGKKLVQEEQTRPRETRWKDKEFDA